MSFTQEAGHVGEKADSCLKVNSKVSASPGDFQRSVISKEMQWSVTFLDYMQI